MDDIESEFKGNLFGSNERVEYVIARALVEIAWQLKRKQNYDEA